MSLNILPRLAITLGDVAGVGTEITAKTLLKHPELRKICVPVVIGDADALRKGVTVAGLDSQLTVNWSLAVNECMVGRTCKVFMRVYDYANLFDGWDNMGAAITILPSEN